MERWHGKAEKPEKRFERRVSHVLQERVILYL